MKSLAQITDKDIETIKMALNDCQKLFDYKFKKVHEPCSTPAGSIGPDLLNVLLNTLLNNAIEKRERLDPINAMGETLMLGLRLLKGVSVDTFERRFHVSFQKTYSNQLPGDIIKSF